MYKNTRLHGTNYKVQLKRHEELEGGQSTSDFNILLQLQQLWTQLTLIQEGVNVTHKDAIVLPGVIWWGVCAVDISFKPLLLRYYLFTIKLDGEAGSLFLLMPWRRQRGFRVWRLDHASLAKRAPVVVFVLERHNVHKLGGGFGSRYARGFLTFLRPPESTMIP